MGLTLRRNLPALAMMGEKREEEWACVAVYISRERPPRAMTMIRGRGRSSRVARRAISHVSACATRLGWVLTSVYGSRLTCVGVLGEHSSLSIGMYLDKYSDEWLDTEGYLLVVPVILGYSGLLIRSFIVV